MRKSLLLITFIFLYSVFNAQTQNYNGESDGDYITAKITWKADKTISGSYSFTSNSSRVYRLSGTNYVEGQIELIEYFNGKRIGSGTLYKTLKKGRIIWEGDIYNRDGTTSYLYLTRSR